MTARTSAERMRRYRDRLREAGILPELRQRPSAPRPKLRPFMGVDGEGAGRERDAPCRQHYMVMCASDGQQDCELWTGRPLRTEDCLAWILDLPAEPILVAYSLGYDVTMICRDLASERRRDLLEERPPWSASPAPGQRRSRYTYWRDFALEYLPGNYFRVARLERVTVQLPEGGVHVSHRPVKGSARTIFDVCGLFDRPFVAALRQLGIGTPRQLAIVARGKRARGRAERVTQATRDYCALECELLAELMTRFRELAHAAGIRPRDWAGSGKLASALHKAHGTLTREQQIIHAAPGPDGTPVLIIKPGLAELVPPELLGESRAGYYGGRFELFRVGRIPGLVIEHDIRSAFPAAMTCLPCLVHGHWRQLGPRQMTELHKRDRSALFLAAAAYDHHGTAIGGLPHRASCGTLSWPMAGQGVYWSPELRSAERLGARLTLGAGWTYERRCECRPFAWIEALYQRRLEDPAASLPIKRAMAALYGKLVQVRGAARWHNLLWAGLTTAIVRAWINDALAADRDAIVMVASDGIFATGELPVPIGPGLGQWRRTDHPGGVFAVQPGFWWSETALRTRGVSRGVLALPSRRRAFERAWRAYADDDRSRPHRREGRHAEVPAVGIDLELFVGLLLAETMDKGELAGVWRDVRRQWSFAWAAKRQAGTTRAGREAAAWRPGPHVLTYPLPGGEDWISTPHGAVADDDGPDLEALELADQPDYVQLAAHEAA